MTTREAFVFPLSAAQEGLWFLNQLNATSPFYNVPTVLRMRGRLHLDMLRLALDAMTDRHESLRTSFATADGSPVQVIADAAELDITLVDLTDQSEELRELRWLEVATSEVRKPFDLAHGPLLRTTIVHLGETDHILVFTMHHIISDGWSTAVFVRELSSLYEAFCDGAPSPLQQLPIQYVDFAEWQRGWLRGETLERLMAHWRQRLDASPTVLELPADRPRPPVESHRGAHEFFGIPKTVGDSLNDLARQEGATLFMALLTGFNVLLHRYTGQSDLAVGTPFANRQNRELEGLIGFFVNTLVLRTDLSGNPTFRQLLQRTRMVCLDAYAHGDLPFETLVKAMQPARDLSRNPLFQVMFILQNMPAPSFTRDLSISLMNVELGTSEFDLTLALREEAEGLIGYLEYSTDLFDATTILRLIGHLQTLLGAVAADPDQHILDLPMVMPDEREQLLTSWSHGEEDHGLVACVHHLVEAQAERTPDAKAVIFNGQSLSYRELNGQANRLAHHLQKAGVAPDVCVGVLMERSIESMVAILATLKAGGAYVPLDASYPDERLEFMVHDSRLKVLLTHEALAGRVSADGLRVLCVDCGWLPLLTGEPEANSVDPVDLENLAYVIYTSGSTGRPKGVAMRHRSVANLITWQVGGAANHGAARTLQFAPVSFDVSFQEIFSTWTSGGTLILVDDFVRRDPIALSSFISETGIERAFLPVIALQRLCDIADASASELKSLREMITAGEQLQITPAVARVFTHLDGCSLHNHYGPTECHVVSALPLPRLVNDWSTRPSIGRPITNARIYLLDPLLEPVPVGVAGELYIGGSPLARGYLHRPDLTAAAFLPDPFGGKAGARLYKTGDLARWRADRSIEFIGRTDHQVKIRGFRVELEEIESVLGQHHAVKAAAVVSYGNALGDLRLCAYLVEAPNARPTLSVIDVQHFLKQRVPDYMVPSGFVLLDALPLTANGKLDRGALPLPDASRSEGVAVPPTTATEHKVAAIWCDVLHANAIGIHENFFDIGGHSLLATQVISRLRDAFGLELPLRIVFEYQTIADLAEFLEAALLGQPPPDRPGGVDVESREQGEI